MEIHDPALTMGRFLRETVARHGDRCAMRFGGESTSYAELGDRARALARGLVGVGAGKGTRVAVHMANRPEWVVSAFAVGLVGGVLVPVNTFASRSEFDFILRHSDAAVLLMQPGLLKHDYLGDLRADHPEIAAGTPGRLRCAALPQLRRVFCLGDDVGGGIEHTDALLAAGADVTDALLDRITDEVEPSDDGILIYTSGTTAQPKGVLHGQRAGVLQGHRFAELLLLEPDDRLYTTYPFFWTAGIAMSLLPCLAVGARLLLQEHFDAGAALACIESERASVVHAWPHQMKALGEHPTAGARDFSAVRKIEFASPLAALAGIEKDEYGTGATYGMSETFTIASALPADAPLALRQGCSGEALPGMRLRIVDPESGAPRAPGEAGEIAVKGVTLMHGYYKVLPENYLDEDGYFRTQDGGFLDADGRLHWEGRLSNLIKTGGANVSPVEIEELLEGHPGLRLAVPVGVGHPTLGEVVVLCAVRTEGSTLDEAALRDHLRARLAAYKVPRRVLFFGADELSYTGNQKVQVAPLKEAARQRLEAEGAEIDGYRYGSA